MPLPALAQKREEQIMDSPSDVDAQIIDVSGDGEDNNTPPSPNYAQNVRTARDAAIAAGVDMINGLPIGNAGGSFGNILPK